MKVLPKRVLMTADTVGGVWTYALELARTLGKYKIEVAIATMGPEPSPSQRAEAAAIPNISLFKSSYRLEWMQNPWTDGGDVLPRHHSRATSAARLLRAHVCYTVQHSPVGLCDAIGHSCRYRRFSVASQI